MKIRITGGIKDVKSPLSEDLPDIGFIPRVNDIIYFKNLRYIVKEVIIDYDFKEIGIWVKDA